MKKFNLKKRIKNIINAQNLAKEIEQQDMQYLSIRNTNARLESENFILKKEKEVLEENTDKYLSTIRKLKKEIRELKNGRKSI